VLDKGENVSRSSQIEGTFLFKIARIFFVIITQNRKSFQFYLKCNKKNSVSLQEIMPVKMAQYGTTARTITLVISVQKMKSALLPKILP